MDKVTAKSYCCGIATGGQLIDKNGDIIKGSKADNAVLCGKTTPIALQAGMTGPKGI